MMELHQIETCLEHLNPQERLRGLTELRNYPPDVVVPLLKRTMNDKEFIVRSFVAIGLGKKQTAAAFEALLDLIAHETDPNVRSEAANSLAKYGEPALPHLLDLFERDSHWLVRMSILVAVAESERPEQILKVCILAIEGDNLEVKLAAIDTLAQLVKTPQAEAALEMLISLASDAHAAIRVQVAKALRAFNDPIATATLLELRRDSNHYVVGAVLEGLL